MDIIKGEPYVGSFYVRDDSGMFVRDLSNVGSGSKITMYNIDDKTFAGEYPLSMDTSVVGKHCAKLNMTTYQTGSLKTIIEGGDDRFMHMAPYYGVIKINFPGEPVLAQVDKINVI